MTITIHIGKGKARIAGVTFDHVHYCDEAGVEGSLDLGACRRRYFEKHVKGQAKSVFNPETRKREEQGEMTLEDCRRVGSRKLLSEKSVTLYGDPFVRFVFASRDDAVEMLVNSLHALKRGTFDRD